MNSECEECKKSFSSNSNLRKHIKKFHKPKLGELLPYKIKYVNKKFKCEECGRNFNQEKHLRFHNKKHGSVSNTANTIQVNNSGSSVKLKTCPLCTFQTRLIADFKGHFEHEHNIQLELETCEFVNKESFEEWKNSVERDTNVRYVKKEHFSAKLYNVLKYFCNRSGYYISRGQGMRNLKTQGSNKIDGYCPASLTVKFYLTGKISVKFLKTHVGHECDIGHLCLTPTEHQSVAEKIASKIPFSVILDEVRDSIQNEKLERLHLSKKDLYNIENAYNLNSTSVRHKDDAVSVEFKELSKNNNLNGLSYEEKKNEIKTKFLQMLDSTTSVEELEILDKAIAPIAPTLAALKDSKQFC